MTPEQLQGIAWIIASSGAWVFACAVGLAIVIAQIRQKY